MSMGRAERIETIASTTAAAMVAAAVGFAMWNLIGVGHEASLALTAASASAGVAFVLCVSILFRICVEEPRYNVVTFDLKPIAGAFRQSEDELVLTDAHRLIGDADDSPLELVDILAAVGPDARVVRLFDTKAATASDATPGELKTRIDRHLSGGLPNSQPPDASRDLHDALDQLRRSLR